MTIRECYDLMGGDYDNVVSRLTSDKLVYKFNKKFADTTEYDEFMKCISEGNYEEAFMKIHSIKGMCANLGYQRLYEISSEVCETMRYGAPQTDISDIVEKLTEQYNITLKYIECMEE